LQTQEGFSEREKELWCLASSSGFKGEKEGKKEREREREREMEGEKGRDRERE
jgi:hypothetical protein